jgi:hypothetical protein
MKARHRQGAHRGVERARVRFRERAGGIAYRLGVARAHRASEGVVKRARLHGLVALVPAPAAPPRYRDRGRDDRKQHEVAVLLPPGLEFGQLFLLFEIEVLQCHFSFL